MLYVHRNVFPTQHFTIFLKYFFLWIILFQILFLAWFFKQTVCYKVCSQGADSKMEINVQEFYSEVSLDTSESVESESVERMGGKAGENGAWCQSHKKLQWISWEVLKWPVRVMLTWGQRLGFYSPYACHWIWANPRKGHILGISIKGMTAEGCIWSALLASCVQVFHT